MLGGPFSLCTMVWGGPKRDDDDINVDYCDNDYWSEGSPHFVCGISVPAGDHADHCYGGHDHDHDPQSDDADHHHYDAD